MPKRKTPRTLTPAKTSSPNSPLPPTSSSSAAADECRQPSTKNPSSPDALVRSLGRDTANLPPPASPSSPAASMSPSPSSPRSPTTCTRGLLPNPLPPTKPSPRLQHRRRLHVVRPRLCNTGDTPASLAFLTKYLYRKLCEIMRATAAALDLGAHPHGRRRNLIRARRRQHLAHLDGRQNPATWVVTPRVGRPVEINAPLVLQPPRRGPPSPSAPPDSARASSLLPTRRTRRNRYLKRRIGTPRKPCLFDVIGDDGSQDNATSAPTSSWPSPSPVSAPHRRSPARRRRRLPETPPSLPRACAPSPPAPPTTTAAVP